jgi:hypothetical protein
MHMFHVLDRTGPPNLEGPRFCAALLYCVVPPRPRRNSSSSDRSRRLVSRPEIVPCPVFDGSRDSLACSRVPRSLPPHQSRPRWPSAPLPACSLAGAASRPSFSEGITDSQASRCLSDTAPEAHAYRLPTTELVKVLLLIDEFY